MSEKSQEQPFKQLGDRLRTIRQKLQESMAEVSGAVEIDEPTLKRIEQGQERPAEDILMLLINHFGMHDDEAASLWKLAGYEQPHPHRRNLRHEETNSRAALLVMAIDPRIIYSDGVQVSANRNGVIIAFSQTAGQPSNLVTTKVGMSREQAYAVISTLQGALHRSEPPQLPESFGGAEKSDQAQ